MIDNITLFCNIVSQRSMEHSQALRLLLHHELYGQVLSILRQELDSMVRVMFLLSIHDLELREHFICQTLEGEKWVYPNSKKVVTDKHMVDLASKLNGWSEYVYKLGCAFIHLSPMTYYKNNNPFLMLSDKEQTDIKKFLHNYHGFFIADTLSMETVTPYLHKVFDKVSSNLGYYLNELHQGKVLEYI